MTYHGDLTFKASFEDKMRCPEKKKWVIIKNDSICLEPKDEECKNCPFNKEKKVNH